MDPELNELRSIAEMRRKMAERLASFSETYRTDVWDDLQTRFEAHDIDQAERKSWFGFLRRSPTPDSERPLVDRSSSKTESRADDLLTVVNARAHLARRSSDIAEQHRDKIWQRIHSDIRERELANDSSGRNPFVRRWVLAAAAAALVVAALGPIPATGFAHHPAVDTVRFAGERLGVMETDTPPSAGAVTETVSPIATTSEAASNVLGFNVSSPDSIPGFVQTSSQLYPSAITANGGMFALTYEGMDDGGTLAIYQEAAAGTDLAVSAGSAIAVTLSDGTVASYIEGSWDMGASVPAWDAGDSQTIVFDRNGIRTIVVHSGPAMDQADLISIAELI